MKRIMIVFALVIAMSAHAQDKKICWSCTAAPAVFMKGGTSIDAVEASIRILNESPPFNAGKGAALPGASNALWKSSEWHGRLGSLEQCSSIDSTVAPRDRVRPYAQFEK